MGHVRVSMYKCSASILGRTPGMPDAIRKILGTLHILYPVVYDSLRIESTRELRCKATKP
jgi:hypothetical protein